MKEEYKKNIPIIIIGLVIVFSSIFIKQYFHEYSFLQYLIIFIGGLIFIIGIHRAIKNDIITRNKQKKGVKRNRELDYINRYEFKLNEFDKDKIIYKESKFDYGVRKGYTLVFFATICGLVTILFGYGIFHTSENDKELYGLVLVLFGIFIIIISLIALYLRKKYISPIYIINNNDIIEIYFNNVKITSSCINKVIIHQSMSILEFDLNNNVNEGISKINYRKMKKLENNYFNKYGINIII